MVYYKKNYDKQNTNKKQEKNTITTNKKRRIQY